VFYEQAAAYGLNDNLKAHLDIISQSLEDPILDYILEMYAEMERDHEPDEPWVLPDFRTTLDKTG
jgi:hypothetical protein